MTNEKGGSSSSWWTSLPCVMTAQTGLLTAFVGLCLTIQPVMANNFETIQPPDNGTISQPLPSDLRRPTASPTQSRPLSELSHPYSMANNGGLAGKAPFAQQDESGPGQTMGELAGGTWTHVARSGDLVLLYNSSSGAGEVKQGRTSIKTYQPGSFATGWTSVVGLPHGLFFYNSANGSAVVGRLEESGTFINVKVYKAGEFASGWTSIVSTPKGVLFYNSTNGSGVVGRFDEFGIFTNLKIYKAGAFAPGWTSVVARGDDIYYRNPKTGATAVGYIDSEGNHITK